jgi:hypothetical protein
MENQQQKTNNSRWIYIAIIGALGALSAYLYFQKDKTETQNQELTTQVETTSNDLKELEDEYNATLARLDQMKSQSVQMDSLLSSKNEEIEELKSRISQLLGNNKLSADKLKEANELINSLKLKLNSFEQQIILLKRENIQLIEDKKQLMEEKEEEKRIAKEEKEQLTEEKKQLEKIVELGSVLKASNFKLEAVNQKKNLLGKEVEKETKKARKADLLRISFDLDDNRISESGEKIIYIVLRLPNGKVSGNQKFKLANGTEEIYTVSKTVPYRQGEKVYGVTSEWNPIDEFESGTYTVEVYHMGYQIGTQKVVLK